MKNVKISTLALSALMAVGLIAGAAPTTVTTPPPVGTNYDLNAQFTNHPPEVADVKGVPSILNLASAVDGVVWTDGSGKIDGTEDLTFTNLTGFGPFNQADFITDITGFITTVKSNAAVTMLMKGNGYAQDTYGSTQAAAGLSLAFKGSGIIDSNSSVALGTYDVVTLTSNSDGSFSTNSFYIFRPFTNITIDAAYQYLSFLVDSSSSTLRFGPTNNTTVLNDICVNGTFNFGTPLDTNANGHYHVGSSNFNLFPIASNMVYTAVSTNPPTTNWTAIYGLDIATVPGFISNYFSANTFTNGSANPVFATTNVSIVVEAITNSNPGGASTNTDLYTLNGARRNLSFSNSFFEIDGFLKGQITAGKRKFSFNDQPASLSESFTWYVAFIGTGANTNLPNQFNNAPSNDVNVIYVWNRSVSLDNLNVYVKDTFPAKVKSYGKNLWMSSSWGFNGAGLLDHKHDTFKEVLTGVARSRGSLLGLTGTIGPLIVDYTILTNVTAYTNLAALAPPSVILLTNMTAFTNYPSFSLTTTNGVGTTNVTVVTDDSCGDVPAPPLVITNIVPDGIKGIILSGKDKGQKVPATAGTNLNLAYPIAF